MRSQGRQFPLNDGQWVGNKVDVVVQQHHPVRAGRIHQAVAPPRDAKVLAEFQQPPAVGEFLLEIPFQVAQLVRCRTIVTDQHLAGEIDQVLPDGLEQSDGQRGAVQRQEGDGQVVSIDAYVGAHGPGLGITQHIMIFIMVVRHMQYIWRKSGHHLPIHGEAPILIEAGSSSGRQVVS